MTGFIPKITTRVSVIPNLSEIDLAVNLIDDSEILSECFTEIRDHLVNVRDELDDSKDPLAEKIANILSDSQGEIISMKHDVTGMMKNSVDVMKDGDGEYLVGNTAMSVDGFPYPLAIEEGTRDHWVEPVTFKALHWIDKSSGEDRFSKGHMVSGITADPYVDYSVDLAMGFVEDTLDEHIAPILR